MTRRRETKKEAEIDFLRWTEQKSEAQANFKPKSEKIAKSDLWW